MTDLTATQKIKVGLRAELQHAEQTLTEKPTLENIAVVRWLKSKMDFYNSEHYVEYKRQNGDSQ